MPVHPRAPATVAHIGVHAVSKVHSGRTLHQFHHRSVRREHIDTVI